ncbi:hypothetical protein VB735_15140 [Halotia wernerae UHCC 0503]|nr:hypothetical protein [Halotia wernerae UHCC 0503]
MAIKPVLHSQYSEKPQIPVPIINVIFEDKGTDPNSVKPIINIQIEFRGWSKQGQNKMWKLKVYLWIAKMALRTLKNDFLYLQIKDYAESTSTLTIQDATWAIEDLQKVIKQLGE